MILAVRYDKKSELVYLRNTDAYGAGEKTLPVDTARTLVGMFDNYIDNEYYRRSLIWVLNTEPEKQERMLMATGDYDEKEQRWTKIRVLSTFGKQYNLSISLLSKVKADTNKVYLYRDLRLFKKLLSRKITQVHAIYLDDNTNECYDVEKITSPYSKKQVRILIDIDRNVSFPHIPIISQHGAPCFMYESEQVVSLLICAVKGVKYDGMKFNGEDSLLEYGLRKGTVRAANSQRLEGSAYSVANGILNNENLVFPRLELESTTMLLDRLEAGYDNPYPIYRLAMQNWLSSKDGTVQFCSTRVDLNVYQEYKRQVDERADALTMFMARENDYGEPIIFNDSFYGVRVGGAVSTNGQTPALLTDLRGVKYIKPDAIDNHKFSSVIKDNYWINHSLKELQSLNTLPKIGFLVDRVNMKMAKKLSASSSNVTVAYNLNDWLEEPHKLKDLLTTVILGQLFMFCDDYDRWRDEKKAQGLSNRVLNFLELRQDYSYAIDKIYNFELLIKNRFPIFMANCEIEIGSSSTDEESQTDREETARGSYAKILYYLIDIIGYARFNGEEEEYTITDVCYTKVGRDEVSSYNLIGNKVIFYLNETKMVVTLDKLVPVWTKFSKKFYSFATHDFISMFTDDDIDKDKLLNECYDRVLSVATQDNPIGKKVTLKSQLNKDVYINALRWMGELKEKWSEIE